MVKYEKYSNNLKENSFSNLISKSAKIHTEENKLSLPTTAYTINDPVNNNKKITIYRLDLF